MLIPALYGIYNTEEEVDCLLQHLAPIIAKLRAISPLNPDHLDNTSYDLEAERKLHSSDRAHDLSDQDEATISA